MTDRGGDSCGDETVQSDLAASGVGGSGGSWGSLLVEVVLYGLAFASKAVALPLPATSLLPSQPFQHNFSFCSCPYVYDPASKARVLQLENQMAQFNELQVMSVGG